MPTNIYGLVGYDRVKNYPLWLKSVSIPDQHSLYSTHIYHLMEIKKLLQDIIVVDVSARTLLKFST